MGTITRTNANNLTSGVGKVLQVVSTTLTNNFTVTTGTSQVEITGLTATITPSSTSNKILLMYKLVFSNSNGNGCTFHFQRNSSEEILHDSGSTGVRAFASGNVENSNNYWAFDIGGSVLDSPSSTSALTYRLTVRNPASQTIWFNRTARLGSDDMLGVSTITVMEIAGWV